MEVGVESWVGRPPVSELTWLFLVRIRGRFRACRNSVVFPPAYPSRLHPSQMASIPHYSRRPGGSLWEVESKSEAYISLSSGSELALADSLGVLDVHLASSRWACERVELIVACYTYEVLYLHDVVDIHRVQHSDTMSFDRYVCFELQNVLVCVHGGLHLLRRKPHRWILLRIVTHARLS